MTNNKPKKVLLISYCFPPDNVVGAVRIGKFAKYLPEFGWEPVVLTVDGIKGLPKTLAIEIDERQIVRVPYYSRYHLFAKYFGLNAVPISISKISNSKIAQPQNEGKLRAIHLFRNLYTIPIVQKALFDPVGWYRPALKAALKIVNNENIDILFSSFSPSTCHIIASNLKKITKIPWIAEFRDPWSINPYNRRVQPFQFIEQKWDKRVLRNSDQIITVSDVWAKQMERFYSRNIIVIPNGFDAEDCTEKIPLSSKFTITYTGTIYPGKRDPSPLFQAISELITEGIIKDGDIEIRFFGRYLDVLSTLMEKYHLYKSVKICGFIEHNESIIKQMESTVLLLLSWNSVKDVGSVPAKTYEYIATGRPILALAYEGGAIDKLLQETHCGIVANSTTNLKDIILKWLNEFKTTGEIRTYFTPETDTIRQLTRKESAKKLACVFDKYTL